MESKQQRISPDLILAPYNMSMNRPCAIFLIAILTISMVACSTVVPQPTDDTTYLTPIPEATVFAFEADGPITTKMQAAMIALRSTMGGHFGFIELPKVISVEKININEAHKRIDKPGSTPFYDHGWSTDVWFVVLEGEIQIIPPPPPPGVTATPWPPFHGCNYYMFDINYSGGGTLGGISCPSKKP